MGTARVTAIGTLPTAHPCTEATLIPSEPRRAFEPAVQRPRPTPQPQRQAPAITIPPREATPARLRLVA
ncbi:MAG: hypothetical protein ACXVHB_01910 [Solirubrobacteraceae bacterium]